VPDETIKAIATTLISSKTKMEMSKAIPLSLLCARIELRALIGRTASLTGINAAAPPGQLHKTRLAGGGIRQWGRDD
jgi:hypothetical protein